MSCYLLVGSTTIFFHPNLFVFLWVSTPGILCLSITCSFVIGIYFQHAPVMMQQIYYAVTKFIFCRWLNSVYPFHHSPLGSSLALLSFFKTVALVVVLICSVGQYFTSTCPWSTLLSIKKYLTFILLVLFKLNVFPFFPI